MAGIRIAAIRLLCPDPEATAAFYRTAFGCRHDDRAPPPGGLALRLGAQRIELVRASMPAAPAPSRSTAFQHFAIAVSDMEAATARLDGAAGWRAISRAGPERLPPASGGATAFKFRDPDGHPLELLRFPDGKVPPPWRGPPAAAGPFLGIDHSAITVAGTETALGFYETLGFRAAARQVNRGLEQERLDDEMGAEVEVTSLEPEGGGPPHLELLRYRRPETLRTGTDAGSVLATRLVLSGGAAGAAGLFADPDGHRLLREFPSPA